MAARWLMCPVTHVRVGARGDMVVVVAAMGLVR